MGSVAYGLGNIGGEVAGAQELQRKDQIEKIKLALQQQQVGNETARVGTEKQYADTNAKRLAMDQQREAQLQKMRDAQIQEIMKRINQSPPMVKLIEDAESALGRKLTDPERLAKLGIKLPTIPVSEHDKTVQKLQAEEEMYKKYPDLRPKRGSTATGADERSVSDKAKDVESGFASLKDFSTKERGSIATYMRENKMQPGGKKQMKPEQEAGLNVLHVALWGDGKSPGLDKTVDVLDSATSRNKMIAAGVGASPDPKQWISTKLFHSTMYATMSAPEKAYVYQLNRAISAINALRTITGLPRSTQALMDRYVMELPNPVTTPSSADARSQLQLIEREIRTAMAGGTPSGAGADGGSEGGDAPPPGAVIHDFSK